MDLDAPAVEGLNPNSEVGRGSTGDSPVPSGQWPDGMGKRVILKTDVKKSSGGVPIPSGGSPLGTGQWPVLPTGVIVATSEFGLSGRGQWFSKTNFEKFRIKFGEEVAKCEIVSLLPVGVACNLSVIHPIALNDDFD